MSEVADIDLSKMTYLDVNRFPPGGWKYREPSLSWTNPDPMNGEGFEHAVALIQMVRAQNIEAHPELDPSFSACAKALIDYTCLRIHHDRRFCGLPSYEQQLINAKDPHYGRRCASCGRR